MKLVFVLIAPAALLDAPVVLSPDYKKIVEKFLLMKKLIV